MIGLSDVDRGAASARRRMREAADAAQHRPLAGGRRRRGLLRAARRLPLPGPPRARRGAARPLRPGGRGADRVRPAPRRAAGRDARAVPGATRQRRRERPRAVHPPEHRAPAARADRARHRARSARRRTCSRWSWRSSWRGCTECAGARRCAGRAGAVPARSRRSRSPTTCQEDHEQHPPRLDRNGRSCSFQSSSRSGRRMIEQRRRTRIGGACS